MAYVIRIASSEADREAVFRGRHRVYVDEMGAMPPRMDGFIRDVFDDSPSAVNLVVCNEDGRVVGGARFMADSGSGTTADEYFDFGPHLPNGALRGAGSMLWMLPEARGVKGLIHDLMTAGHVWSNEQGLTHILATVNPPVADRFARVGYRRVGDAFLHGATQLPIQPMLLDVRQALAQA